MQKLFEQKLMEQQNHYQSNIQQCEQDYEKKLQTLKQENKQLNDKYQNLAQHSEQLQNELKQKNLDLKHWNETAAQQRELIEKSEKAFVQIKNDLERKFHEKVLDHFSFSPSVCVEPFDCLDPRIERKSSTERTTLDGESQSRTRESL